MLGSVARSAVPCAPRTLGMTRLRVFAAGSRTVRGAHRLLDDLTARYGHSRVRVEFNTAQRCGRLVMLGASWVMTG